MTRLLGENFKKKHLDESLDLHDKVFNLFNGKMTDDEVDAYIKNIKDTHKFNNDEECLKYIGDNMNEDKNKQLEEDKNELPNDVKVDISADLNMTLDEFKKLTENEATTKIHDFLYHKYGSSPWQFNWNIVDDNIVVELIRWTKNESLGEDLEEDAMEDFKSEVYHALSEIYAKYELKGATLNEFDSAVDFATIHMRDEFDESLKEDANEPKLETFEEKIDFLVKDEDEAIAGYDKIIAMLGDDSANANAIEQLTHIKEEEIAHKDFLEVLKKDPSAIYEHEDEEEQNESLKEDFNDAEYHKAKETFVGLSNSLFDKYDGLTQEYLDEIDAEAKKLLNAHKDSKEWAQAWKDFSEVDESLNEDKEEETEVESPIEEPVEEHPIETTVEEVKEIASEVANKVVEPVSTEEEAEEQQEAIEDVVDEVVDDKFGEDDEEDDEMIVRDNDELIDVDDDFDDDFGFGEGLKEDTVKKDNKWVNKGKEGTHGEFKTKKEADAQRKAMFANGYHEEVEEDFDDDFGDSGDKFVPGEAEHFGITVDWDDLEDDVDEEDAKTFKKVIKSTDDKILDKHFGKGTPERKLVGAIKNDIDEEAHETGHIKAKKPIELRARR